MLHPRLHSALTPQDRRNYHLRLLLKAFANCLKDYNEVRNKVGKDVAYWYGERTLTGLLSGAVWRMKGERWALEEFKSLRQVGRKKKDGRGDLWFGLSRTQNYTLEAKLHEESSEEILADKDMLARSIQAKLEKAFTQLAELKNSYKVGHPMTACFVVPYFLKTNLKRFNIRRVFVDLVRSCRWKRPETAVGAFWYAKGGLPCLDKTSKYYLAPGVVLVLQWQYRFPSRAKKRQ